MQYSNSKLKNAAFHIKYEVEMLNFSVIKLQKKLSIAERNAYIEVFILHARNLYEFLFASVRKYKDDMIWSDFLTNNQKSEFIPKNFKLDTLKANKQLAHLSYMRNFWEKRKRKNWNITEIHAGIMETYKLFLGVMSKQKRKWFK